MVKYFVTLVLLACVALECTNINNRIFARSEAYKHPHHHLRHQKYGSMEPSDQKAHRDHQQSNNRQNTYPAHPQSHNLQENLQPENEQYSASQGNREIEEFSSNNTEESEEKDPFNVPTIDYALHKQFKKTSIEDANLSTDSYATKEISGESEEYKADMLRDQIYNANNDHRAQHGSQRKNHRLFKALPTIKCPKCESNRQNVHVSEEELTRLRIEFVKRQILEKLRLKDKPNVTARGMPKPIYEETTIHQDEQASSKDLDDYYARASKKFIFLEREKHECHHLSQPSICFSFKIDDLDLESIDVSKAVLWIFKKRNAKELLKQTIVVSEVEQGVHNSKYLPKVKPIAIQSVDVQEGWMKIDIEWPIKRWFGIHELSHLIHISCQSCEIETADGLISTEKDYRPFIMIDTQNRRRVSRQKRSVNCTNGVTECCREKLYISFDEIGWGDWIIRPRGYDAYFCRGSCSTAASIAQSTTHHSSLMRKVISHRDIAGKKPLELIPCCTANQYSSLEIFFRDSNNTATLMKFPNMVIESCGCM